MTPDDITPTRTIREGFRWFPATVIICGLAFVLIAGLVLAGKHFGWWLQEQNASHSYSITTHGQGYQTSLLQEMEHKLSDISDTAVLRSGEPSSSPMQKTQLAQQMDALRTFCTDGAQLTAGNPAASQLYPIYSRNCAAGTVIPNPPLLK